MTDGRPSTLYVKPEHGLPSGATNWLNEATVDEVLAYVRRGVESGEIEGAEHTVSVGDSGELHVSPVLLLDEAQTYLVILVERTDNE